MKVIVSGSRNLPKDNYPIYYIADAYIKSGFKATEIVAIDERKIGVAAKEFAEERGIPFRYMRVNTNLNDVDAIIAIWDGSSTNTEAMLKLAGMRGLKVYIYRL